MTRVRISHSWRTIRGMRIRIAHRRRVAVKPGSSILRLACQGMATERCFMININAEPKPSYERTEEELDKATGGRGDHEALISQIVITKDADSQSHKL